MKIWILVISLLLPIASSTEEKNGCGPGTFKKPQWRIEQEKREVTEKKKDFAHYNVKRLNDLYTYILNPLEKKFGAYYISSLYREHDKGHHGKMCAVDLDFDMVRGVTNADAWTFIRDSLPYTQLIQYHRGKHLSHIHVGLLIEDLKKEVLRCYRWKGRASYKKL